MDGWMWMGGGGYTGVGGVDICARVEFWANGLIVPVHPVCMDYHIISYIIGTVGEDN